jgi:hypothetical protein
MKYLFLALAALALTAGSASATLTLVTNRGDLGADDYIDWQTFIPSGDGYIDGVGGGNTHSGNSFSVYGILGHPEYPVQVRRDADDLHWEYQHDYLPGDAFARGSYGSTPTLEGGNLTLDFLSPVSAVGSQVQSRVGTEFTVQIDAFAGSNLLGTFYLDGVRKGLVDGSAPFVGVSSSSANITRVVYRVTNDETNSDLVNSYGKEVWVNEISLRNVAPVPEPASIAALGLGVVIALRRRRPSVAR